MKRVLISLSIVALLNGCAVIQSTGLTEVDPTLTTQRAGVKKEFDTIPAPAAGRPVSVAVYSFADKTGQRKTADAYATFSSAVTQGAESWLIDALRVAGNGTWFKVLERASLDNLIKERQLISQTRETFQGKQAEKLSPMLFAGVLAEGGIIGYDTNILTGGAGASILGITGNTQYRKDVVTVSLRFISVQTGEVLLSVAVTKTITSVAVTGNLYKFYEHGTLPIEAEIGLTANEPNTIAVRSAIDQAVIEIVNQGSKSGLWKFKPLPIPTQ